MIRLLRFNGLGSRTSNHYGARPELDNPDTHWLGARGGTLAGGSNEMQRNIISE